MFHRKHLLHIETRQLWPYRPTRRKSFFVKIVCGGCRKRLLFGCGAPSFSASLLCTPGDRVMFFFKKKPTEIRAKHLSTRKPGSIILHRQQTRNSDQNHFNTFDHFNFYRDCPLFPAKNYTRKTFHLISLLTCTSNVRSPPARPRPGRSIRTCSKGGGGSRRSLAGRGSEKNKVEFLLEEFVLVCYVFPFFAWKKCSLIKKWLFRYTLVCLCLFQREILNFLWFFYVSFFMGKLSPAAGGIEVFRIPPSPSRRPCSSEPFLQEHIVFLNKKSPFFGCFCFLFLPDCVGSLHPAPPQT